MMDVIYGIMDGPRHGNINHAMPLIQSPFCLVLPQFYFVGHDPCLFEANIYYFLIVRGSIHERIDPGVRLEKIPFIFIV